MKRQRLFLERVRRGLTQEQVAKQVGISRKGYSHIETARRGASTEVWDALEDLFKVDQRELRAISDAREAG